MSRIRPGGDARELRAALGVFLFDAVTGANRLAGGVEVSADGHPERPLVKAPDALFVFLALPDGDHTVRVRSAARTPYYRPAEFAVSLPMADRVRPTFPDEGLADPALPLADPMQTPEYRDQRAQVTLMPTPAYPFPPGATLVRGTVRDANKHPVAGVDVVADRRLPDDAGDDWLIGSSYRTGSDGEFVLFFRDVPGAGEAVEVRTAGSPTKTVPLVRGGAVTIDFEV